MAKHLVVVTRSWPVTQGQKGRVGDQGTNSKKGHEATARNPTVQVFRENAEHLMCDLTTGWILESAQSLKHVHLP